MDEGLSRAALGRIVEAEFLGMGIDPRGELGPGLGRILHPVRIIEDAGLVPVEGCEVSLGQDAFLHFPERGSNLGSIRENALDRSEEQVEVGRRLDPLSTHDHDIHGADSHVLFGDRLVEVGRLVADDHIGLDAILFFEIGCRFLEVIREIPRIERHRSLGLRGRDDGVPFRCLQIDGGNAPRHDAERQKENDESFHTLPPPCKRLYLRLLEFPQGGR